MTSTSPPSSRCALVALLLALMVSLIGHARADDGDAPPADTPPAAADAPAIEDEAAVRATLDRLAYIQGVIGQRSAERAALLARVGEASEQESAELTQQADALSEEIVTLRRTLESIATGGVDSSVFDAPEESEAEGDWREDVALIAQPIIDSLKDITEKPRRIKELNDVIAEREEELALANAALGGLAPERQLVEDDALGNTLERLAARWQKRADDATAAIDIARFQIANLRGDKPLWRTAWEGVVNFATGRGLTLLMAVAAAMAVWFGTRFALSGYRRTLLDKSEPESRTRFRLAEYSMHAFIGLMMLVAVFVVFYQRGDVLLLGVMILLFIGLALGARQLLPRYVNEARLLLNIGPIREGERLLFRELPWRVESVNMYTVLRNPELHGVLRVPLKDLDGMVSRPVGRDPWFPSSKGDVVLLDDGRPLVEVIDQNPDTVTLRERGGQTHTVPSAAFYQRTMVNLTRNGSFGVECSFGVDYDQQSIATQELPKTLTRAVREALGKSDLAEFVKDVEVELKAAGDSSIDFWLFATMHSRAAKSFRRIERLMQAACVDTCTREGWNIPFPHLSVVAKHPGSSDESAARPLDGRAA